MLLLPFDGRTLVTSLPPNEVRTKLTHSTGEQRLVMLFRDKEEKPLTGAIGSDTFRVHRTIHYRNSFLPVITGRFERKGNVTDIRIAMRMHVFTIVFMSLWLGVLGTLVAFMLLTVILGKPFLPVMLVPLGMFTFGYLLMMGAFLFEHRRSLDLLKELLNATEI